MRIEIHPKPDGMQHINLMFCNEDPGPEDLWVSAMLNDFPTPPKRELQWERDGRQYKVLQYGQCVIGNALFYIEKHKGIVDRILKLCREEFDHSVLKREEIFELISETALEFNQEAKYTVDGSGELTIAIDEAKLRERMIERLGAENGGQEA
ncbi:MAG: hypothetical protein AB7P69_28870 [Candidatus Binatia bacterium]